MAQGSTSLKFRQAITVRAVSPNPQWDSSGIDGSRKILHHVRRFFSVVFWPQHLNQPPSSTTRAVPAVRYYCDTGCHGIRLLRADNRIAASQITHEQGPDTLGQLCSHSIVFTFISSLLCFRAELARLGLDG